MIDNTFKLREKTTVICGPQSHILQSLVSRLSELGADVAVLSKESKELHSYCRNIMDLREVNEKFGRAALIHSEATSPTEARSDLSRAVELFGSMDIYIDLTPLSLEIPYVNANESATTDHVKIYQACLDRFQMMAQTALEFIKGRNRGRVIVLSHQLDPLALAKVEERYLQELINQTLSMARDVRNKHISINHIAVGLTEEYLISRFPHMPSMQKTCELIEKDFARAEIIDSVEVANFVSFIASSLSTGFTGQTLNLNYGL